MRYTVSKCQLPFIGNVCSGQQTADAQSEQVETNSVAADGSQWAVNVQLPGLQQENCPNTEQLPEG